MRITATTARPSRLQSTRIQRSLVPPVGPFATTRGTTDSCWQSFSRPGVSCRSVADGDGDSEDYSAVAARLNALLTKPSISGKELREMVFKKWGRTYDVRLTKLQGRMYLQVMWRFLEQKSFPLSEKEYMQQLDAVAEYLTEWGVVERVKAGITGDRTRGPGYTGGGNARCVSIPLEVDLQARGSEWN